MEFFGIRFIDMASATYDIVGFPPLRMANQIDGNGKPSNVPQTVSAAEKNE